MDTKALDVVIVGGSLVGLMQGIALKHLGHNVHVLEQSENAERQSQAAGIGCGPFVRQFCEQHGIDYTLLGTYHKLAYELTKELNLQTTHAYNYFTSSWSVVYHALRAHFDGFVSESCLQTPPPPSPGHGKAVFDLGKRVLDISISPETKPVVTYEDTRNGQHRQLAADFIIAADGAMSTLRRQTVPNTDRVYSGYVAWRGTVPERDCSQETSEKFQTFSMCHLRRGTYMVVYKIPSDAGNLEPGSQVVNWLRYEDLSQQDPIFRQTMTDVSGKVHRNTLPLGQMQSAVWEASIRRAEQVNPDPRLLELLQKTKQPFITAVSDVEPPDVSTIVHLAKCRCFLIGEAFALQRPHTGNSTNQAAMHVLAFVSYIKGEITATEWAARSIQFHNFHANFSKFIASRMMGSVWQRLKYLVRFLFYAAKGKLLGIFGARGH